MPKLSDEFLTPLTVSDLVKQVFGRPVDFDPYYAAAQVLPTRDGLSLESGPEPWPHTGHWWANIPFSESAEIMPRLARHFTDHPQINAIVLCLAAPSSIYWHDSIWSKQIGARRVGWIPRVSFLQDDGTGKAVATDHTVKRDIALSLWTSERRIIDRFERFVPLFDTAKKPRKTPRPPVHISVGGRP
jgi:hypothetical protein